MMQAALCRTDVQRVGLRIVPDKEKRYEHAGDVRAAVERIAFRRGKTAMRDGQMVPNWAALEAAARMKRGALSGIASGSEPLPRTLVGLARYTGESPVHLFITAGWLTDADIDAYVQDRTAAVEGAAVRERAIASGETTQEEIDVWMRVSARLEAVALDRQRVDEQRAPDTSSTQNEPPPMSEQA